MGSEEPATGDVEIIQYRDQQGREHPCIPNLQLDREGHLAVYQAGKYSDRALYFAKERPVVYRDGNIIMVDDDSMRLKPGEKPEMKKVRFRTLGCYPLTGGVESDADTLDEIIEETLSSVESERTSRVIDNDGGSASMERRKREGYF